MKQDTVVQCIHYLTQVFPDLAAERDVLGFHVRCRTQNRPAWMPAPTDAEQPYDSGCAWVGELRSDVQYTFGVDTTSTAMGAGTTCFFKVSRSP